MWKGISKINSVNLDAVSLPSPTPPTHFHTSGCCYYDNLSRKLAHTSSFRSRKLEQCLCCFRKKLESLLPRPPLVPPPGIRSSIPPKPNFLTPFPPPTPTSSNSSLASKLVESSSLPPPGAPAPAPPPPPPAAPEAAAAAAAAPFPFCNSMAAARRWEKVREWMDGKS